MVFSVSSGESSVSASHIGPLSLELGLDCRSLRNCQAKLSRVTMVVRKRPSWEETRTLANRISPAAWSPHKGDVNGPTGITLYDGNIYVRSSLQKRLVGVSIDQPLCWGQLFPLTVLNELSLVLNVSQTIVSQELSLFGQRSCCRGG